MLASPWWNLLYLGATATMMGYAYFSRHEHVQKLALFILAGYIISQISIHTEVMYPAYLAIDSLGLFYAAYLRVLDPTQRVTAWIMWIFVLMILLHLTRIESTPWLQYQIAGNLLFLAQLGALCIYGKHYGTIARAEVSDSRSDLYYRALVSCRLMT